MRCFAVALILSVGIASATAKPFRCFLEVDGTNIIDGPCEIVPENDEIPISVVFQMGSMSRSQGLFVAQVEATGGGQGVASWNGKPNRDNIDVELGPVDKTDGCWLNSRVRACYWQLDARGGNIPAKPDKDPPVSMPVFLPDSACKHFADGARQRGFSQGWNKICLRSEQYSYDVLKANWSTAETPQQLECVRASHIAVREYGYIHNRYGYTQLLDCMNRVRQRDSLSNQGKFRP